MPRPRAFETGCTVEVSHRFESLHAHIELDGDLQLGPGDQIQVHGAPINPAYGETVVERRTATVTRATWPERFWTRLRAEFEITELFEVSFTDRRTL